MKWLLHSKKLDFVFTPGYVSCISTSYYQINGILSFAILDLAYKIIKQHKRKSIILKKRKPIIHLLNYIDALNFNSKEFGHIFFFKNRYKTKLVDDLYLYQNKHFEDLDYKDCLKVIRHENSCTIRFNDSVGREQSHNVNLAAMVIHILEKQEPDDINVDGIMFYCLFLM